MMIPPSIRNLILDMDGVLWIENRPIGDLASIFHTIRDKGYGFCLATNNSTRTPEDIIRRLERFQVTGLQVDQIVTSSQTLAHVLAEKFPQRGYVYAIGENGLTSALKAQGFEFSAEDEDDGVVAVAMGMDRGISFTKLRWATLLIRKGVPFYATNPDRTFPTPQGLIPGAGSLISALIASTDVDPIMTGKPKPFMIELALARLSATSNNTLVVGDRLDTDILAGATAGCQTALVLSGISTEKQARIEQLKPDIITQDLSALLSSGSPAGKRG